MMDILTCIFMSILMMVADGFIVHGPAGPLVAPLGSSVVLLCYVDELLLMEDLEVEWRRTDSEALVHLYQDGGSRPEAQQQDYYYRAYFFTDQIQHGNFSLRLDNLRAEDEGRYTCRVYSQQDSGETEVQIIFILSECLIVSGSDRSVSAYDGEDVTLSCSVDSHIKPEHIEKVLWRKTDGNILVLLYQNNDTLPDSSDEQYRDRVEFFTAEIPKGNFSLRLKSVRTEDKGVYMCLVFAGGLSANATAELEQLGFSSWHIAVLFFCFAATSGAVLLLCCLIYYRSKNTVTSSIIWNLQLSLVFCPNICMFFAFMLWGFTEGSLHETVTCCALYILRPEMLIWALRYLKYLQGNLKSWIRFFRITRQFAIFTVVVYSVLFTYGWRKRAHDTDTKPRIFSAVLFGIVVLSCLILSIVDVSRHPSQERPSRASHATELIKDSRNTIPAPARLLLPGPKPQPLQAGSSSPAS
ncbi:butyrophilin-like protein 8 [Sinocyclocheilus grahami]|uniref:butyrophilin-like protein 8 n=1 Tax=Sinocyclocheilus grahami TaxID=75366 RepID=UPI0007AD64EA|nr:PREDICTED: butyrophilin-like protein 8 [Sinocyclocheilus grahami]